MGEEDDDRDQQGDEPGNDSSDESESEDEEGFVDIYDENDPNELNGFIINDDLLLCILDCHVNGLRRLPALPPSNGKRAERQTSRGGSLP